MGSRSKILMIFSAILLVTPLVAFSLERGQSPKTYYRTVDHCRREGLGLSCFGRLFNEMERHPDWATQIIALSDGEKRTYLLRRPDGIGPKPTIIVLHGVYGNGLDTATDSGLGQFAPDHGFVGVFPSARRGLWNAFPPGGVPESVRLRAGETGIGNDVLFLRELVADLVQRRISDPKRIYLAGLSMGGFMALEMACADTADFGGIALVASSMPDETGKTCSPAKPIPLLVINGTADKSVPYFGGPVGASHYNVWATDRLLDFFRRFDGCDNAVSRAELPALHPGQVTHVTVLDWTGCKRGRVTLYRVQRGEHEFPPIGLDASSLLIEFFGSAQ